MERRSNGLFLSWNAQSLALLARAASICVIADLFDRWSLIRDFLTQSGVLPLELISSVTPLGKFAFILPHFWADAPVFHQSLMVLQGVLAVLLFVRARSALCIGLLFWLHISQMNREPFLLYGGDSLLSLVLGFLLIQKFSSRVASAVLSGFLITLYFHAGYVKWSAPWFSGEALSLIGWSGVETTPLAESLLTRPWFSGIFSPLVPIAEIFLPALALCSKNRVRSVAAAVLLLFHLSHAFLFELGFFPWLAASIWGASLLSQAPTEPLPQRLRARSNLLPLLIFLLIFLSQSRFLFPWRIQTYGLHTPFQALGWDRPWGFWANIQGSMKTEIWILGADDGNPGIHVNLLSPEHQGRPWPSRLYPSHRWHHQLENLFLFRTAHRPPRIVQDAFFEHFCRRALSLKLSSVRVEKHWFPEKDGAPRISIEGQRNCQPAPKSSAE
ncbi:MAG: HTTM domain-containing protein [Bdellovibrionaceae bacterium]|nr:HTTM domain-containing protein [Pseudobdellovibrionaceae bacterium]